MRQWVLEGIKRGIKTTCYPKRPETAPGVTPGLPCEGEGADAAKLCPVGAIKTAKNQVKIDRDRCIHCYRCHNESSGGCLKWEETYEWAYFTKNSSGPLRSSFKSSTHILVVDAGSCGACLSEVELLNNPYYNMHRLGLFVTPSPRKADILLVVGPATYQMHQALKKAYDAMPTPKRVMAVGTCALTGGVFGQSFVSASSVSEILPVDINVPGDPPPPLAILHGLLLLSGKIEQKDNRTS